MNTQNVSQQKTFKAGKSFGSQRNFGSDKLNRIPSVLRYKLMNYCQRSGMFYDKARNYIIWHTENPETGEKTSVRVFLEHHRLPNGKDLVIARNNKQGLRINLSVLFQVEEWLGGFKNKSLVSCIA